MSYSLTAFSPTGRAKHFNANNNTYRVILTITHQLCPETFAAVTIHPPEGASPQYRPEWGGNDGQSVNATDAANLGHALSTAIADGKATEALRAYCAEVGWDGRYHTGITIVVAYLRYICEFAIFLAESNGFDIR